MTVVTEVAEWLGVPTEWLDRFVDWNHSVSDAVADLDQSLDAARVLTARAIADERRLSRELQSCQFEVERWRRKAAAALTAGREDLARVALACQTEHERSAESVRAVHAAMMALSQFLRSSLPSIEVRQARVRREIMRVRDFGWFHRESAERTFAQHSLAACRMGAGARRI